ncbi:oxidoreductase [Streptomyces griseus]
MQRPWYGNAALTPEDHARGDTPWTIVAPSAIPMDDGWLMPHELTEPDLKSLREDWRLATLRAVEANFDVLEIHCAHGYLLHEFLSPLSNRRKDAYGGDRAGRMKYPLEIIETVRAVWPSDRPLFVRISSVDGIDGGIDISDLVAFVNEAKARGADVIDCSSGAYRRDWRPRREFRAAMAFRCRSPSRFAARPRPPPWPSASSCIRIRPKTSSRKTRPISLQLAARRCSSELAAACRTGFERNQGRDRRRHLCVLAQAVRLVAGAARAGSA